MVLFLIFLLFALAIGGAVEEAMEKKKNPPAAGRRTEGGAQGRMNHNTTYRVHENGEDVKCGYIR